MGQRREERASRVKSYFEHISATLRKQSMDRKRQEEMRKSASSRKEAAARIKAAKEAEAGAGSDTASSPDKAAAKEAQKRAVERIKVGVLAGTRGSIAAPPKHPAPHPFLVLSLLSSSATQGGREPATA